MKLIRAEFENYRLLRQLDLDFSTDKTRKLTVIRAENESGKTTILNGLQWALYGDDALPEKGRGYRLHPIDWDTSEGKRVPISVLVDFEITKQQRSRRGIIETKEQYRIIRSVYETLDGVKKDQTVNLFHLTDKGGVPIEPPEVWIRDELPSELKEVFFTDGDRALSFIEATVNLRIKRERVEKAIESLLGLGVIENALKHVRKTASEVNKEVKRIGSDEQLMQIAADVEQIEKDSEDLEEKIKDSKSQFAALEEKRAEIQNLIDSSLSRGNREELKLNIRETEAQLKRIDNQRAAASKEHTNFFAGLPLTRDILAPTLKKGLEKLNELRSQGKLPNATIPVLEERLNATTCICGESLDPHCDDGTRRRNHIQHLIDDSRKVDALQNKLTDLYYGSLTLLPQQITDDEHWVAMYAKVADLRYDLENQRKEQVKKLNDYEIQLERIPDTGIKELLITKRQYEAQRDRFYADQVRYETQLEGLKVEHKKLASQRENLLRQQRRGARILARLEVTSDIERVLKDSYERITNEELTKVSQLMNVIFLEMIGADPDQGAIIQKAEISKDFDILVYGPNDRALNPDRDLNGASRRALTLAFILALTKVSEFEAPNVIDTPLGMMSGYVKRSVLKTTIRESSQLVLFLTRSEIADCEEILDAEAGRVITLTNPAHYPRMLVNDPQVKERKVLRCECNHHQECELCQRQMDAETENITRI